MFKNSLEKLLTQTAKPTLISKVLKEVINLAVRGLLFRYSNEKERDRDLELGREGKIALQDVQGAWQHIQTKQQHFAKE